MAAESLPTIEGKADFHVGGEVYQTWYKVVGDLKSGKRPLVALHGGPGVCHLYLSPLNDLVAQRGIPVVYYDQIGSGSSTYLPDKPKDFWQPQLFIDELTNLLNHLSIVSDYDLLGHSWGGMLGAQFAAQGSAATKGMKRLIICDSPASIALWEEATGKLLKGMPQEIQDMLKKHEDAGTTKSEEFQRAIMVYYTSYLCRVTPMPEDLANSLGMLEKYPAVYNAMYGSSQFQVVGSLKTWSIIDELHKIKQSTLVINGAYDEAQDICVAPFFNLIPKAKWITFAQSSHVPQWEEREKFIEKVGEFLALIPSENALRSDRARS